MQQGLGDCRSSLACVGRFLWPSMPGLAFAPAAGHLQAGAEVAVTATFQSDVRAELAGAAVALKLTQITYKGASTPPAWPASAAAEPLPAPVAEPEHSVVPKSEKELAVKARCMTQKIWPNETWLPV